MSDKNLMAEETTWADLSLDGRVLKAVIKLGWERPTLVQASAIPLALKGRDVLAKARTGSGKTGAFAVPIVQKILTDKEVRSSSLPSAFSFKRPPRAFHARFSFLIISP